jgi:phosphoenolpyruvate carboxykinase (GTP)
MDVSGLKLPPGQLDELLRVDVNEWHREVSSIREHYAQFNDRLPGGLAEELEALKNRLG